MKVIGKDKEENNCWCKVIKAPSLLGKESCISLFKKPASAFKLPHDDCVPDRYWTAYKCKCSFCSPI